MQKVISKSVLLIVHAILLGAVAEFNTPAEAQQILDTSGRYICQSGTVRDVKSGRTVAASSLVKSTNKKIKDL